MDKITLDRILTAHPAVRDELTAIYAEICERLTGRSMCRFAYVLRTFAEQDALYAKVPRVTKAKGGQSWHNYGLAVDIVLIIDGKDASWDTLSDFDGDKQSDWMEAVYVFGLHGWEWGGNFPNFKDMPHFQKRFGMTIAEALNKHNSGQTINGYIKLPIA